MPHWNFCVGKHAKQKNNSSSFGLVECKERTNISRDSFVHIGKLLGNQWTYVLKIWLFRTFPCMDPFIPQEECPLPVQLICFQRVKEKRPHDDLMQSICCRIADQTHFSAQRNSSLTAVSAIRKEQQISVHEACISLKCDKSTKLPPEVLSQPSSGVVPSFYPKVCLLKRFTIYICIILLISS